MCITFGWHATEATTVIVSMGNDLYVDEKKVDLAHEDLYEMEVASAKSMGSWVSVRL